MVYLAVALGGALGARPATGWPHRLSPLRGTAYAVLTVGLSLAACATGVVVGQA